MSEPQKKKPTRKTKITITPTLLKQIQQFAHNGMRIQEIGSILGYTKTGWFDFRKRNDEIDTAYNVGKNEGVNVLQRALMRRALDDGRKDSGALALKMVDMLRDEMVKEDSDVVKTPTTVNIVLETRTREEIEAEAEVK